MTKRHSFSVQRAMSGAFSVCAVLGIIFTPAVADASTFPLFGTEVQAETIPPVVNGAQKNTLVAPSIGPSTLSATTKKQVADVVITGQALSPLVGPVGSALDVADLPEGDKVTSYTVHSGDTIASVANLFNVTKATIMVANDLAPGAKLKPGDTLIILPMSGQQYVVKKNETLGSISRKYKVDPGDIAFFNDIASNADLIAGDTIIIPDPDFDTLPAAPIATPGKKSNGIIPGPDTKAPSFRDPSKPDLGNALLRPVDLSVSRRTQGPHGWNKSGVDIAAPIGTPIHASYDGIVAVATEVGYNGGYGKYVVIDSVINGHTVRTVYGHMSKVIITPGATVSRGQLIGLVGSTGNSTGSHVHWEVRGALNPVGVDPRYTGE